MQSLTVESSVDTTAKKLLEPLQLGPVTLSNRLVQAPLAGYSCAPFRVLTQRYGDPGFCSTEMISAKDLVYRDQKPKRYVWRDPEEKIVCYQIAGSEPEVISKATEIVSKAGADIIDLNCGCPVKKIRSKGIGSKLLIDPENLYQLVKAMRANTNAAVSIKIRVAAHHKDSDDIAVAQAAQAGGAHFMVVHGRHWRERYDVPSRTEEIAKIVEAVDIPVFANGDVSDPTSAIEIASKTKCAGLMIARASVGDPWLFQKIRAAIDNNNFQQPSFKIIGQVLWEHIERLSELENDRLAVLQSRKLAKYYSRYLPERAEFTSKMQVAEDKQTLHAIISDYFDK